MYYSYNIHIGKYFLAEIKTLLFDREVYILDINMKSENWNLYRIHSLTVYKSYVIKTISKR